MKKEKKPSSLSVLMGYAGSYMWLTIVGCVLSAISMLVSMVPYICIWLAARDLIAAAPDWEGASHIVSYGWIAFGTALIGIIIYFIGLIFTHLAAFRTASNMRREAVAHLMKTPLGYLDQNASGLVRNRIDAASADTEQLLAHNLADISGTAVMFIATIILLIFFDWRMGAASLIAAVISIASMCAMMSGEGAKLMGEYYAAQDRTSKAATEYVRGIPVIKVFQQTVYYFTAFKDAIEEYGRKADEYQGRICKKPQSVNLTFIESAFVFLVPVAILIAPGALARGDFAGFLTDFVFYAVFSSIIATSLNKLMFVSSGIILADTALSRIATIIDAPTLKIAERPIEPRGSSIEFDHVSFTYEGSGVPAIDDLSFSVKEGETIALVGPSGGGKTTAASLIPRFYDVTKGRVLVGNADVRDIDPHVLMDKVAFVFQNDHLFKASVYDNVAMAKPSASREEVLRALSSAQCDDIIAKLPEGVDTLIGTGGTYLSGGEAQRVSLARALLKDAPIVVLDEATAFADPENELLIQRAFHELLKGKTVIMIAHRLSTVVGADRILVLDEGRLVESGTHEELLARGGMYEKMWDDYGRAVSWRISSAKEAV